MTPRVINNNLVVPTTNPGQLRALFPQIKEATVQGQTFCAVPHTLEAARVLNNIGIPAQSPILTQYDWPGRYTPRWYQSETSAFFTLYMRCYCHSAMRTGKTLSALWAADYLRRAGHIQRTMIVAPLSTIYDVWQQNIFESFPLRTFNVIYGSRQKRLDLLDQPCDFYVVNHHGVGLIEKALAERPDINHFIIDECFPAKTNVLTPTGERYIETLKVGDEVCTSHGGFPITHVFKRNTSDLLKLHFEDGSYVECTPEHPIATDQGWRPAKDCLGSRCLRNEDLPTLRRAFYKVRRILQKIPGEILQPPVQCEGKIEWCSRNNEDLQNLWKRIFCPTEDGKVQTAVDLLSFLFDGVEMENEREHARGFEESGAEEERYACVEQGNPNAQRLGSTSEGTCGGLEEFLHGDTRGKWYRNDCTRKDIATVFTKEFPPRCGYPDKDSEGEWVSYLLQSGLWGCYNQSCCRGRRDQPCHFEAPSAGQKKRGATLGVRVESIQNIECPSPRTVYNLEVRGPETYIANGKVVHNCAVHRNARNRRTKEKKGGVLWAPLNEVLNNQGIVRSAWGLTGTPTPNEPTDAFGQCKLITPENYSGHFTSFKQETMMQLSQFKWVPKRTAAESVARLLRPSIRFERSVCTDMEPCLIDRRAELSTEQSTAYKQLINQAMTELNGSTVTAVNAAVLISKLIQTSCGVCIGSKGELVHFDFGPRYSVLEELIEENNEKVLVFVPFTGVLDALAEKLRKRWSVAVVGGGVSINARTKIFKEFRTLKDPHVLVCHPRVMAHGLDLTAASLAIWYAPHMNAEDFQQANARIDGSRQTVKIDIARIYATAEEKRAYAVIDGKDKFQNIVLDLSRKGGV